MTHVQVLFHFLLASYLLRSCHLRQITWPKPHWLQKNTVIVVHVDLRNHVEVQCIKHHSINRWICSLLEILPENSNLHHLNNLSLRVYYVPRVMIQTSLRQSLFLRDPWSEAATHEETVIKVIEGTYLKIKRQMCRLKEPTMSHFVRTDKPTFTQTLAKYLNFIYKEKIV